MKIIQHIDLLTQCGLRDCCADLRDAGHHEIGEHLDVVVVLEAVLYVAEELEDVEAVHARVQQGVHALEGSLQGRRRNPFS